MTLSINFFLFIIKFIPLLLATIIIAHNIISCTCFVCTSLFIINIIILAASVAFCIAVTYSSFPDDGVCIDVETSDSYNNIIINIDCHG